MSFETYASYPKVGVVATGRCIRNNLPKPAWLTSCVGDRVGTTSHLFYPSFR